MPSQRRQGVVMADRNDADLLKETQHTHAAKFQEEKAFRQSVSSMQHTIDSSSLCRYRLH